MNPLTARMSSSGQATAATTATSFFTALAGGEIGKARGLAATHLVWFGEVLSSSAWLKSMPSFFKGANMKVERTRSVSPASLSFAPAERQQELFDGPITNEQMVLVDLLVGTDRVTAAVLIDCARGQGPKITRVFEPTAYKMLLAELQSAMQIEKQ